MAYIMNATSIDNATVLLDKGLKAEVTRAINAETSTNNALGALSSATISLSSGTVTELGKIANTLQTEINRATNAELAINNTITALSGGTIDRIGTTSAATLGEAEAYSDNKLTNAISNLTTAITAGDNEVIFKITETNGLVDAEAKALSLTSGASGLYYVLKLGNHVIGEINIPEDQFLSSVTFIASATQEDQQEAWEYGQTIELGKPYLKFIWKTATARGIDETFVDVSGLIDVYDATDIKLSDSYTGSSYDIKSGTTLEDAVAKITNELTAIEEAAHTSNIASSGKTILIASSNTGTNVDVHIDNETIVKNDSVSKYGEISVKLDINKQDIDTGYVRTKYTLKSKTGTYGVINDTREIISGSSQFITVESEPVQDAEGNRTNKTTISPVMTSVDWNDINGMSVDNGNGLATAYEVKQYVKDGIDGDNIYVGNDPLGYLYGRIDFSQSGISYDNVHQALLRTDNNMVRLDETIGLAEDGPNVHLYPSAETRDCLLISGDTTIMSALKTLDKGIDNMHWTGKTTDSEVFTGITETDGHVSATTKLLTAVKLSGYSATANTKVAANQTLGQALGNLQGQIDSLNYTKTLSTDYVFNSLTEVSGLVSTTSALTTSRTLGGLPNSADTKIAANQTLGQALANLQGQINSMNKTASAKTGQFVRTVVEADGKVTEQKGYIVADDVKISAATGAEVATLGTNVKEAYKLINQEGVQLGDWVKIYKDSSLKSVTLSGDTATTGQWLIFTYILADGSEDVVAVDVSKFLVQAEFTGGVKANNAGIVSGVVDTNSEKVYTAYDNAGNPTVQDSVLSVGVDGFKVSNIQTAIDKKIETLDSSAKTTGNGYYVTGIAIKDGLISGITQAKLTDQETKLSSAGTQTGNVLTSLTVSDHQITLGSKNIPEAFVTGNTGVTVNVDSTNKQVTIGHGNDGKNSQNAGTGKFVQAVNVDTFGHVTGITTADTVNSASTATNAVNAETATTLASAPSLTAEGNNIKVSAGNQTSAAFTVPFATNATNATNAVNADTVDGFHIVTGRTGTEANTIYFL
jgi:hypothetical protein